jgi:hypothetical protein
MTRRLAHFIALVALLAAMAVPVTAAASPSAVVRDCAEDGSVDGDYSNEDKKAALGQIPADLDEYSDCRSVIAASIRSKGPSAGIASVASGAGGGGDAAPTRAKRRRAAAQRRVRKRAAARRRTEELIADRSLTPATAGVFDRTDTANGMPLPVLLALIALTLLLLGSAFVALARRNPGMMAAIRRVPLPRRSR